MYDSHYERLVDYYLEHLKLNDPLTKILDKGNFNEFKEWLNCYNPIEKPAIDELISYYKTKLTNKLIEYEYYEWIIYINSLIKNYENRI